MKEEVTIIEATIPNDAVHVKKYVRGPHGDRIDKIGWWLMGICFAPFLLFGLGVFLMGVYVITTHFFRYIASFF